MFTQIGNPPYRTELTFVVDYIIYLQLLKISLVAHIVSVTTVHENVSELLNYSYLINNIGSKYTTGINNNILNV